jgi:hypothetical protein
VIESKESGELYEPSARETPVWRERAESYDEALVEPSEHAARTGTLERPTEGPTPEGESAERAREDRVVDVLAGVLERSDAFRPECWAVSDVQEKLAALREAEAQLCSIDDRVPPAVSDDPGWGAGDFGTYNGKDHAIEFGTYELQHRDVREAVDTLVHEDRHAYQQWAIDNPGKHSNPAEVAAWRENSLPGHQVEPNGPWGDPVLYREQARERDAWSYAERITGRLFGGPRP